ncbi:MAG: ADP-ribosylglycohydrolase family protein [Deltaproteobacteria bacterium]|jgi:ADP-ribosylglycohydrolase|nr:ADP-ribosylglycohydrolase family protein [Deltaproteobacteria bacterium]
MTNTINNPNLDKAVGALLGTACGDALGWPNERVNPVNSTKNAPIVTSLDFKSWSRRSGGLSCPYEENIDAGCYSDTTQLILCVARAILSGEGWAQRLVSVELPFWTIYERSGDKSTIKAIASWKRQIAPWASSRKATDIKKYFYSWGNGVTMRILPHAIFGVDNSNFSTIANNIIYDGIATHGHPRALISGLAYGYAVWTSLLRSHPPKTKEILEDLLDNANKWALDFDFFNLPQQWIDNARKFFDLNKLWKITIEEMLDLLNVSHKGLENTSANENNILDDLGCFNYKFTNSSLVTVAGVLYLASKYSSEPLEGLTKATYLLGSDTGTIGAMTGALLGIVNGKTWLQNHAKFVQDYNYLNKIASNLILKSSSTKYTDLGEISDDYLQNWSNNLAKININDACLLPDGRNAKLTSIETYNAKDYRINLKCYKLLSEDEQLIYAKSMLFS